MTKYLIIAGKNITKSQVVLPLGMQAEFVSRSDVEDDKAYLIDNEQPMLGLMPLVCRCARRH